MRTMRFWQIVIMYAQEIKQFESQIIKVFGNK